MVGNWSEWKAVRWYGEGHLFERVRAYRSWFGFIREERERKRIPVVDEASGIALLKGERVILFSEHYAVLNEAWGQRNKANDEVRQLLQANEALAANNAGLKQRADYFANQAAVFEEAYRHEKAAYDELLKAVQTAPTKKRARRGAAR